VDVAGAVAWVVAREPAVVALDGPVTCAPPGAKSRPDERDFNDAGICRIRWTPEHAALAGNPYYEWIEHGLELHAALADAVPSAELIEVFPTAAWTVWTEPRAGRRRAAWTKAGLAVIGEKELDISGLPKRMNQDDRDAIAAALVARRHLEGRTQSFGEIVVPIGAL
jgi:Protein of unknown function (DUF429)